mgnify:CR=1 FL=1
MDAGKDKLKLAFKNELAYQTQVRIKSILETVDMLAQAGNMQKVDMIKKIKEKIKYEVYSYSNYVELFGTNLLNDGEIPSFIDRKESNWQG